MRDEAVFEDSEDGALQLLPYCHKIQILIIHIFQFV